MLSFRGNFCKNILLTAFPEASQSFELQVPPFSSSVNRSHTARLPPITISTHQSSSPPTSLAVMSWNSVSVNSYNFTFQGRSHICKMSLCLGRDITKTQMFQEPGWTPGLKKERRHDGVGPKCVSGKSINGYIPVITATFPLKPGNSREFVTR